MTLTRARRNIAIIAHVDHGKTTLVYQMLRQSGAFRENQTVSERVMDSNALEKERVMSMDDSKLLLIDAVEGPMPQNHFVTKKALAQGLQSIVVVNKIDRPSARADWVINQTFDLFDKLGASEQQLDFPVIYASGLHGYAGHDARVRTGTLQPLFEAILQYVPVRTADPNGPLQLQIAALDYSSYVGRIGIGR